ncbi:MAG: acyl carrier protein [Bacteroidetes bacterium]|nr:MAG: acyl carrier protein [Bacteroidota bacterium]
MTIEEIIRNLVTKLSNLEADAYSIDKVLGDDFGIDSLDLVELIMSCEREFGILIHDEELSLNHTPAQLTELVKSKISEKNMA